MLSKGDQARQWPTAKGRNFITSGAKEKKKIVWKKKERKSWKSWQLRPAGFSPSKFVPSNLLLAADNEALSLHRWFWVNSSVFLAYIETLIYWLHLRIERTRPLPGKKEQFFTFMFSRKRIRLSPPTVKPKPSTPKGTTWIELTVSHTGELYSTYT